MNRKLRMILIAALSLVFVVSVGKMGLQLIQYGTGDQVYGEAEDLVDLPDLAETVPLQAAPVLAPEDTPMISGAAMGFENSV